MVNCHHSAFSTVSLKKLMRFAAQMREHVYMVAVRGAVHKSPLYENVPSRKQLLKEIHEVLFAFAKTLWGSKQVQETPNGQTKIVLVWIQHCLAKKKKTKAVCYTKYSIFMG